MLISVIIPTYNDTDTLPQTIAAVQAQTGIEMEVIVVNDAGENPTALLPADDKRFRLLDQPDNQGVSAARNRGYAEAKGDIIYFLDADDIPALGLFGHVAKLFEDPSVNMLFVKFEIGQEAEDAPPVVAPPPLPDDLQAPRVLDVDAFCTWFETYRLPFVPSVNFVRRSWLAGAAGTRLWHPDLRNGEDTNLYLRLAMAGDFHYLDTPCVTYRHRPGSQSRKDPLQTWQGRIDACQDVLDTMDDYGDASTTARNRVRRSAWKLRQNAVRRIAKLKARSGARRESMALMSRYLSPPFDPKMALEILRTGLGYRH